MEDELGLWLQWRTASVPADVTTAWDADGGLSDQDDPALGLVATQDPAWDGALAMVALDGEFQRRRELLGDVDLHVVVADVDEWLLTPWPSEDQVERVVLTLPSAETAAAQPRTDFYLDAVATLVASTQQQLGLDD